MTHPNEYRDRNGRILNVVPSRDTEQDWRSRHALEAGMVARGAEAAAPDAVDLREHWWSINDQKETGACVGWATGDSVLRWHFVQAGRLHTNELLSARFLWMASKESDEFITEPTTFIEGAGTSLKAAVKIARKFGVVRDSELPFEAPSQLFVGETEDFYAIASRLRIAAFFNLGRDTDEWRSWLAAGGGPILVRLGVDQTWDEAKEHKGMLDNYLPDTVRGGHAVAIVGYTADGRFIIRNSWGTGWGFNGFGFASERYAAEAFTEAYGVSL